MVKWFKSLSRQEKVMLLLILVLLIGVILRWDNVKRSSGSVRMNSSNGRRIPLP